MSQYYNRMIGCLEAFTKTRFWKAKLILILVILVHLANFPNYSYVNFDKGGWPVVKQKIENLTAQTANVQEGGATGSGHAANMVYRLTVPAIAKVFHLGVEGILVANIFMGIGIFWLIIAVTIKASGDPVSALLMAVAAATIYLGKCAFGDFYPLFDQWAYFFLLLAMVLPSPVLVFAAAFLAAWTDERALLSLFFVFFWWKAVLYPADSLKFSTLFKFDKFSVALILSVVSYAAIRLFMKHHYALTHHVFDVPKYIMMNLPCQRLATWSYFEGLWIVMFAGLLVGFKKYGFNLFFITLFLGFAGYLLFSYTIGDITRTGTYLFPLAFIAIRLIMSVSTLFETRLLLFFSSFICFIFPPFVVSCSSIEEWLLGGWVVGDFIKYLYYDFWLEFVR